MTPTPPLRPDQERDEHAARGRGDGTVRCSRPRTWGAHDTASRRVGFFYHPITITCGISGRLLVVDASALLRAHRGRGRLGDRRRPAPSAHTWPVSARIEGVEGRARPRTVWRTPRRTQRRTRGPRCTRGARDRGASRSRGGCRDAELSPACACRRSSAAHGARAGQPPRLQERRVCAACAPEIEPRTDASCPSTHV